MTQSEMVLAWLRDNRSITPIDALREFGCFRLGARIYDLKQRGIVIAKVMEKKKNADGKWERYARYSLVK